MKLLVVLLTLCASSVLAQETGLSKDLFFQYEQSRLDKGEAVMYTLLFPGGGLFYAGDHSSGTLMLLLHAASVVWILESSGPDGRTLPLISLAVLRIADYSLAMREVELYNYLLLKRLRTGVSSGGKIFLRFDL